MKQIRVAEQFSEFPLGRVPEDGPNNGEKFRKVLLVPALQNDDQVVDVFLDGTKGYPSSFLEEGFGGLVRSEGFSVDELTRRLRITAIAPEYQTYVGEIWEYIAQAAADKDTR